jgi:hypothetical protein
MGFGEMWWGCKVLSYMDSKPYDKKEKKKTGI